MGNCCDRKNGIATLMLVIKYEEVKLEDITVNMNQVKTTTKYQ